MNVVNDTHTNSIKYDVDRLKVIDKIINDSVIIKYKLINY